MKTTSHWIRTGYFLAVAGLASASLVAGPALAACLPTPPPPATEVRDWRDQVIYFLMIDRFDDGDPGNNDQGAGEFDPADPARFSGGDLKGACNRLDYIQGLGATAVWITPPVANQWWDGAIGYGGYHGYWASDFMSVDKHFGDMAGYRRFADALHARGMALVQDVVVNHTGNFFRIDSTQTDAAAAYRPNLQSPGVPSPARWPFTLNDPRRRVDRTAGIYHWTPPIRDFSRRDEVLHHALADLDDLATENPRVRQALRESYGHWLRDVGVDAFRVDTAIHVEPGFFRDFLYADDAANPGILELARRLGKPDFHVFGEGFGIDPPYVDTLAQTLESYTRDQDGPLLPAMINFPLYDGFQQVFARGQPTSELAHRIRAMMRLHHDPYRMPTFIDNHDVERFLANGNEAGLRQALLALMTLPGIPVIYYGTEQGLREQRASLFAHGWGSGGRDHFDTASPLYRYLAAAIALRRGHRLFSRGVPTVLAEDTSGAGVLAWRIDHAGEQAVVLFNSADQAHRLDRLDTGLPPGQILRRLFNTQADGSSTHPWSSGLNETIVVDAQGRITLPLPARAGQVWQVTGDRLPLREPRHTTLQPLSLPTLPARDATPSDWQLAAHQDDPVGDDTGPSGRYVYPDDTRWRTLHPGDLRHIRVEVAGGSLRVSLDMAAIMTDWNPPNGFDHVNFTLFLELPGRSDGVTVMPLQNAHLPAGMRWHYRWRTGGWSSLLSSAEDADATREGRVRAPAPGIHVDRAHNRLTITLAAAALDYPDTFEGARLYLSTWDYDGGYRPLAAIAGANHFGGAAADAPKVLDDSGVIVLHPSR